MRVIALEHAAAGPFGTRLLADGGAEVIKIERPGGGDVVRGWDHVVDGLSSGFVWLNRGKKSIAVDLKNPSGSAALRRLAGASDVFLTNFAPGVADRLGLGYETLAQSNPRLIYCSISGYGSTGPYRDAKAYDLLIQGESGLVMTTGTRDHPAKIGISISDIGAGMYAALGICMALYQRETTGSGQFIDVSMFEAMLDWLGFFPHHYWHAAEEPERVGMRHHYIVPYGMYLARDSKYVNIAVGSEHDWTIFCQQVIERPELSRDPRFMDAPSRRTNRDVLERLIEELFLTKDSSEWFERLRGSELAFGEVRTVGEALAHPQVAARRVIRQVASPVGPVPTIESALRLSDSPSAGDSIPSLGGDSGDILRGAGFSESEIAVLRDEGAIFLGAEFS